MNIERPQIVGLSGGHSLIVLFYFDQASVTYNDNLLSVIFYHFSVVNGGKTTPEGSVLKYLESFRCSSLPKTESCVSDRQQV